MTIVVASPPPLILTANAATINLVTIPSSVIQIGPQSPAIGGGGGITDHGNLSGLSDNDHPQYKLNSAFETDTKAVISGTLLAGANVTLTPTGDDITIASTGGGGGGITAEDAVDAVAGALTAGTNIDIAYNDTANTITIDVEALTIADISTLQTALTTLQTNIDNKQPLATSLTTIAGLFQTTDNVIQSVGSAWASRTPAQLKGTLALTPADVTLGNVNNTSDADKPISTATQSALDAKVPLTRTITTTAPLTINGSPSGDLSTNRTLDIDDFTTSARGAVPTPGGTASGRFLKDDGTWALPPSAVSSLGGVFPFTYNTSTAESITGSQLRGNNTTFASSTKLWVSETTVDGLDVSIGLGRIKAGFQVYVQDYTSSTRYVIFNVTADAVDKGTYREINVVASSSAGTIPGGKVAFQYVSAANAGALFSTTTTAAGLTPGSNGVGATYFLNAAGAWTVPAGGGGGITTEDAVDAVAGALVAGNNIDIAYVDASNTITIDVEGLTSADVGLGNVDNTTDLAKPISTATQTALDGKQTFDIDLSTLAALTATTDNFIVSVSSAWASRTPAQVKTTLALNNVDNTTDATKPVSTATQTALDLKGPIRRTVKADTTTAYAAILTDENQIVTLSNAASITVTLPSNSTVAFPIGSEVDFLWLGAGQPTFAAGGGATVNGTPGLKLRAQYSAATAKKIATDTWVVIGDLTAT